MTKLRAPEDKALRRSMRRALNLITTIAMMNRWWLVEHETLGWTFKDDHGNVYDGSD